MRLADVGQQADIGTRRRDQHVEVAELARPHLDDRDTLVAVLEPAQEGGDADFVVLVLRCRRRVDPGAAQQAKQELLGRRLAGAPADPDHAASTIAHAAPLSNARAT